MGITKKAATIIGLQIPISKIAHATQRIINLCHCVPQSADTDFCPKCGKQTNRIVKTISLNKVEGIVETDIETEYQSLYIGGYPTAGNWREDNQIYVGFVVSSTGGSHASELSDPELVDLDVSGAPDFIAAMKHYDLWDEREFGIWTVMIAQ